MEKWKYIAKPLWRWFIVTPFTLVTAYNLFRQEIYTSAPPLISAIKDIHWLWWLLITLVIVVLIVVEGYIRYNKNKNKKSRNPNQPLANVRTNEQSGGQAIGNVFGNIVYQQPQQKTDKIKNEFENVDLVAFDYPWTEHQLSIGGRGFANFLKLGLRVINNNELKIRSALRMMDLKYNGKGVIRDWAENDEWVDIPNPIEKKLLKWDEGYNETEGKIDIAPSGGLGSLLFAESNPYSMEFWFWYVDGKSKNHQVLEGRYKAFVQLEGDCEIEGIKSSFLPIPYEVEFTYKRRKLENVEIRKVERM